MSLYGGKTHDPEWFVVAEARIEAGQVEYAIEQMVHRILKSARQKLPLQVHREESRTGVDVFVTRHLLPPNITRQFDLDIYFGSRHDAQ
ncbi:MAG: hypothetical protein HY306_07960 [Nitrosomonadales bacterium]|nr:hypothetical protein [Nitrosomonadales bacterium]